MQPTAIILLILVLAFIVLYITRPFFGRQRIHSVESSHELSSLLAERERLLVALQELDSDESLEKIPAEDYLIQRSELLQRGAEVLRQIDVLSPATAIATVEKEAHTGLSSGAQLSDEDLDDLLAKRRNMRKDKTAGFCPNCGKPVLLSDAFCPSCGHALKKE